MIADLKPYPAYKDSAVPWLGEVPEHWGTRPLKRWVRMNAEVLPETTDPDRVFRYLDIGSVGTGVLTEKPQRIRFGSAPSRARRVVHNGDTIVSTVRTYLKAIYFVDGEADELICSTGFAVLTPHAGTLPKFVSYLAQSNPFTDRVTADSIGIAYPAIAETRLGSFHIVLPSLPEQAAIVRFLDHADRRIRRYIRAKQKLIKLLEEQKQAIIHRAVTRGLDPNVRLKPSGTPWLGDVPEHWEVKRLRNVAEMRVSNVDKNSNDGELPVRLCNYVDVYKNDRIRESMTFMRATATLAEIERFRLQAGDILITKDSEAWNDIGVPALVEVSADDLICGYHLALLRPFSDRLIGAYLLRSLQSTALAYQFHVEANGVTRYGLSHSAIKSIWVPIPPLLEQASIVRYVNDATANLADAVDRTHREIALLREYRTRLIADVVTGKLDVRDAAASLPEEPGDLEQEDELDDTLTNASEVETHEDDPEADDDQ